MTKKYENNVDKAIIQTAVDAARVEHVMTNTIEHDLYLALKVLNDAVKQHILVTVYPTSTLVIDKVNHNMMLARRQANQAIKSYEKTNQ